MLFFFYLMFLKVFIIRVIRRKFSSTHGAVVHLNSKKEKKKVIKNKINWNTCTWLYLLNIINKLFYHIHIHVSTCIRYNSYGIYMYSISKYFIFFKTQQLMDLYVYYFFGVWFHMTWKDKCIILIQFYISLFINLCVSVWFFLLQSFYEECMGRDIIWKSTVLLIFSIEVSFK